MRKLTAFIFITLDGYFKDVNNDIGWHQHGEEEARFSAKSMKSNHVLLFGRKTYQMMERFWPTDMAFTSFPKVAKGMNEAEKIVFSKKMRKTNWVNTSIVNTDVVSEVKTLKRKKGNDMTLLGSGTILTLLSAHNLIDEYQIMIDPIAIGKGTPVFKGLLNPLSLQLTKKQIFKSGTVVLYYKPK